MASSPYAQRGELYNAFRKHYGKDDARVLVWKASTLADEPRRSTKRIIAEAYEDDPESAKAEYGAEFRTDLADFVTRETVDAVTMWGRSELPPEPGVAYFAFVDPSGGGSDSMTLGDRAFEPRTRSASSTRCLRCGRRSTPRKRSPSAPRCCAVMASPRSSATNTPASGRSPDFAEHGIEFEQSARPKSDLYHDLLAAPERPSGRASRSAAAVRAAVRPRAAHRAQRQGYHRPCPGRPRRPGQRGRRRSGRPRPRPPAAADQAQRRVRRRRPGRVVALPLPRHCRARIRGRRHGGRGRRGGLLRPRAVQAAALYPRRGGWAVVAGFLHRHRGAAR